MKLVTVSFDDTVDITTIAVGTEPVTVGDGTVTIEGGTLLSQTVISDPEVVPHYHEEPEHPVGPAIPL